MLEKLLKKLGVTSVDQLNSEEKITFDEWEEQLRGRKITDEDTAKFLQTELETAIGRLIETNLSLEDMAVRKAEVKIIRKIQDFLAMPGMEKKLLERQLEAQIK